MSEELDTRSHEAEIALLGSIIGGAPIPDFITGENFHWRAFGWAWEIARSQYANGITPDAITIGDELDRNGQLAEFGYGQWHGRVALSKLRDYGTSDNAEYYANLVLDYASKREIEQVMAKGAYWAKNGRRAADIKNDVVSMLSMISGPLSLHSAPLSDALSEAWDYAAAAAKGEITCVPTGYVDLNNILAGGYSGGEFAIIAARPGQGKTALLTCLADNMATSGKKVMIFSLEMLRRQIAMRLLAMHSGIPYGAQKSGRVGDWDAYNAAIDELAKLPVVLCDLPHIKISQIRKELLAENTKGKVDVLMLDYIQLAASEKSHERRDLDIAEISRGLKELAMEFDIPVIAAAQLSRQVEQRSDKRPWLSDLGESSSLEKDSDIVHFIYRDPNAINESEIITAKNRNGEVGTITLIWRANLTRFENAAKKEFIPEYD